MGRYPEAYAWWGSVEQVFLKVSQDPQESTCVGVLFLIRRLQYRCFCVNFVKFLRTPFFTEHLQWLLLDTTKHVKCEVRTY